MKRKPSTKLTAKNADPHELYEASVQQPQVMIGFIEEMFEQLELPIPTLIREDFCGTAQLASMWVASDESRHAIGVDIDPQIIQYAHDQNRQLLNDGGADRLKLITGDVHSASDKAQVLLSLNFSHFIYKTRKELVAYFKHAHACIEPGGMIIIDAFGGPGAISACKDERNFSVFTYIWEQEDYNPMTNEITCRIHFKFKDGTKLKNAFVYDWRMWSLPELSEMLEEAGFGDMGIYFESEDGFIGDPFSIDAEAWVAYIAAYRD